MGNPSPSHIERARSSIKSYALPVLAALLLGFLLRGCFGRDAVVAPPGDPEAAAAAPTVWTCSMHPQIQAPNPGLCPLCGMDLIPLTDAGDAGPRTFATSEAAAALMDIQVAPVERKFVEAHIRMVGKVAYAETRLAYITAWVPGRIDELYVDFTGVRVNPGDHMVYLYSPQLISAQEELRQAGRTLQGLGGTAEVVRNTARTTLEAARERLRLWGLTPDQIAQAEQGQFSDHVTIYAPIGGTVIDRRGTVGQYVDTGTPIYTLADLGEMWVLLDAYESDLQWIRYGQKVQFATEAYPGEIFEGTISFITPFLGPDTRTAKVRVNVDNSEGKLKPEMFVRAEVHSQVADGGRVMDPVLAGKWICPMHPEVVRDQLEDCPVCGMDLVTAEVLGYLPAGEFQEAQPLVIPASAPLMTGRRAVVYVKIPDAEKPTFEGREIVLGPRAGDYYIVRSGLQAGELVVAHGNFKIDSALQIVAKTSMMLPDGARPQDSFDGPIPLAAREALAPVLSAQDAVQAADSSDRATLHAALERLTDAIAVVDPLQLPGELHLYWEELARRVQNDAVEAQHAGPERRLARALDQLHANLDTLRRHLKLEPEQALPQVAVSDAFKTQVRETLAAYLTLQQALAGDDLDAAKAALSPLREAWRALDAAAHQEDLHAVWMPQAEPVPAALEALQDAADLDAMRVPFEPLSMALLDIIARFGIAEGAPAYRAHCPMAFDNRGADWIQVDQEILNPYFGAMMLRCGSVVARVDAEEAP